MRFVVGRRRGSGATDHRDPCGLLSIRVSVGVVTDDADLIPAMLSAHAVNDRLTVWVRRQQFGAGLNDAALSDRGLRIHCLEEERDG